MKRNAVAFLAICILAGASAGAAGDGVEVTPAVTDTVEASPRAVTTTAFRVANVGKEKREFVGHASLPQNWQLVTQETPFQLDPGQSDVRLVSFFSPPAALAGRYPFSYSVADTTSPSIRGTCTITVVVPPVASLAATLLEVPQYRIAGEDYHATFLILNQGNSPSTVAVKVESSEGFPVEMDAESFQLAPGESQKLAAKVTTDPEIRQGVVHRLRLTVTAPGPEEQEVSASARSFVEIIPRVSGIEDPFHRLPVRIGFRGLTQRNRRAENGFQGEVLGSGTLDEEGTKHLDFLFRGPDLQDKSILGQRDEYRLSYEAEDYSVRLGDRGYSLSPLTESFRYGRGAEGNLNLGDFGLGGYYEGSRWLEPKEEQAAAHLNYRPNEDYQFGLNYLKKNERRRSAPREELPRATFSV